MSEQIRGLLESAALARRNDQPQDAHRLYAQALSLARQRGTQRELIDALKGLGQIERDMGQGGTLALYEEAVAICRDQQIDGENRDGENRSDSGNQADPLLLAHTVRHLGDIHQDAGRLGAAEPCYREALAIYRTDPGTGRLDLANALRPLAILQESLGNSDEAILLWREARDIYAVLNIREGVAEGDKRIARLSGH